MGTYVWNVEISIFVVCFVCVVLISGDKYGMAGRLDRLEGTHNWKPSANYPEQTSCRCPSCMTGPRCEDSVAEKSPKFSNWYYFVEVEDTGSLNEGSRLNYNSTTYPHPTGCPCPVFEYHIKDVHNVMNDTVVKNDDTLFVIDKHTGEISITMDGERWDLFKLTVVATNINTNVSDETKLEIARKPMPLEFVPNQFSPEIRNGFDEESHHRGKRAIAATDVTFTLTKLTASDEFRVGSRGQFKLEIVFPTSEPVDMLVELFAPDNDTTVMVLCNVVIVSIGINLSPQAHPPIQLDSKDGDFNYRVDRAIIDFGTMNPGGDSTPSANTITITYDAVMIDNSATATGSYQVSAGAEYANEMFIVVSQCSVNVIYDSDPSYGITDDPVFNITAPTDLALGGSYLVEVEMYIPYPSHTYTFKVFTPIGTSGIMSICMMSFDSSADVGANFGCTNDFDLVTSGVEEDPIGPGNAIGTIYFGKLLNKGSRDSPLVFDDHLIRARFGMHLYNDPSLVDTTLALGLSLEVSTDVIWIGQSDNYNVIAEITSGLTDPVFQTQIPAGTISTIIGEPFTVSYDIVIPTATTANVATHTVLELLAPTSGSDSIFSVCSFEVVSVGSDIPCLRMADLRTVYTSRSGSGYADTATLDLGHVINLGETGDNLIRVTAVLSPVIDVAVDGTPYQVVLGGTAGASSVSLVSTTVTMSGTAVVSTITTNDTAPSLLMDFHDNIDQISVGASAKINIIQTSARDTTYPTFDLEFLMPYNTDSSYLHVCKAVVESTGNNTPCVNPEFTSSNVKYFSRFSTNYMDRARMDMKSLCNKEVVDDVNEDKTTFALYVKVLDVPALLDAATEKISAGLQFSDLLLWVGQLSMIADRATTYSPSLTLYGELQRNDSTNPIPIGLTATYSLLLKIPPGDHFALWVDTTSSTEGLDICSVRVKAAGSNLPCVQDETVIKTNTRWPNGGKQMQSLDFGIVTNYGSDTITALNVFDSNSVILDVTVSANPNVATGNTYSFAMDVYLDSAKLNNQPFSSGDIMTTTDSSNVSIAYPNPVLVNMEIGEIAGNDTDTDLPIGGTARILFGVEFPEGTAYEVEASITIPASFSGKLEISDAAIVSHGDNLPCVDVLQEGLFTSTDGTFNNTVTFILNYVCSHAADPGNASANTLIIEAYVRAMPNGQCVAEEIVSVTGSVKVFANTPVTTSLSLTIKDESTFVDRVKETSMTGVTNDTLITINEPDPIFMSLAENITIQPILTIPKYSEFRFLFDVDLPVSDSACLTIRDIRVVGSIGRNVLCVPGSVNTKGVVYTPIYNESLSNGQQNYVYLDGGIIINSGLTDRRGTWMPGDDDVQLEVDIQMADCSTNEDSSTQKLSLGGKLANFIYIYDHDIMITRDGKERPDIILETKIGIGSTSTVIDIEGVVYHNSTSMAEGKNTSVFIYLPNYQLAPGALMSFGSKTHTYSLVAPDVIEISFESFYFVDIFTFSVQIAVNTSVELPAGYNAADTLAFCEVGTDYVSRSTTTFYDTEDWFPYYTGNQNQHSYSVDAGTGIGCDSALGMESGAILDCQLTGSTVYDTTRPPTNARLNGATGWRPFIRQELFAEQRFLQVNFGNKVRLTKLAVQQNMGATDMVTQLELHYSNDLASYFITETITLTSSPLETVMLSKQEVRGVRIYIKSDASTNGQPDINVKFEFYGCTLTSDVADPCTYLPAVRPNSQWDFTRGFTVGAANQVYVCDRDPTNLGVAKCYTSTDLGQTFTPLDPRLGAIIGYESSEGRVYGFGQNWQTYMESRDDGVTWQTVDVKTKEEAALMTWTDAVVVPEDADATLLQEPPHFSFSSGLWGASYTGLWYNSNQKLFWETP